MNTVQVDGDAVEGRSLSTLSFPMEVPVRQATDQEDAGDEENIGVGGAARKKLRLSKEQSAFLEDSFKEHSTLTPVCVPIPLCLALTIFAVSVRAELAWPILHNTWYLTVFKISLTC